MMKVAYKVNFLLIIALLMGGLSYSLNSSGDMGNAITAVHEIAEYEYFPLPVTKLVLKFPQNGVYRFIILVKPDVFYKKLKGKITICRWDNGELIRDFPFNGSDYATVLKPGKYIISAELYKPDSVKAVPEVEIIILFPDEHFKK